MELLEQRFHIHDGQGLHARAATRFAETAAGFGARIEIERDGASGDGKNAIAVLMLVAGAGDEIRVRAKGPDAREALAALATLVMRELGATLVRERGAGRR
jgi:phosphocarrier protein HPr